MTVELIVGYAVAILVLLVGSVFFSSADMAYGSISLSRMERDYSAHPTPMRKRALSLAKDYDRTISTILLWNDAINAGLDTVSTLLGMAVASVAWGITDPDSLENYGLVFSMSFLVLKIVFGEIIAKSLGKLKNLALTRIYSYPLTAAYYLTFPITFLVGGFGAIVSYPFLRYFPEEKGSEDGLEAMIDESEESGTISEEEADFVRGTVDFATAKAYEIMTPRVKVYAVEASTPVSEILHDEQAFSHSRIPVYQKTVDNLLGYVLLVDLIKLSLIEKNEDLSKIIRPIAYFPRLEEVSDIFEALVRGKEGLAAVIDEYGGFEGLISKEDIVEEVVGEIWDETDHPEEPLLERDDGSYISDGAINLEEVFDELGLDIDESGSESETLGGFLTELILIENLKVGSSIEYAGYRFTVLAIGKRKSIRRVLIEPLEKKEREGD